MGITDTFYNLSPIFLQNMLISAYGLKLKHTRYGGIFNASYQAAKQSYTFAPGEIAELQNASLLNIVNAATQCTPYYIETIRAKSSELSSITTETLKDYFPVLDKDSVKNNPSAFYNFTVDKKQLKFINTSGTTGTPLNIAVTNTDIQKNYAFYARLLDIAGGSREQRSITFAGRMFIPPKQLKPPFWRYNIFNNDLLMSSYRLSESTISNYLHAMEKWKPAYIDAYPSAIYTIAKYIIDNNIRITEKPTAIITSSETLIDGHRHIIEQAFGCKVFDHYGCAEMAAFITQCAFGNYHINQDYGIVEILDKNGRPANVGEIGEIVCTGFINHTMPLIRYRIGDSAILSDTICKCGCAFPVIERIEGRTDDLITAPDGRKIGRLDPLFKGLSGIKETQIIQTSLDAITLLLVKDTTYTDETAQILIQRLKERIGEGFNIRTEFVDHIERTASGKFRSVISRVNQSV